MNTKQRRRAATPSSLSPPLQMTLFIRCGNKKNQLKYIQESSFGLTRSSTLMRTTPTFSLVMHVRQKLPPSSIRRHDHRRLRTSRAYRTYATVTSSSSSSSSSSSPSPRSYVCTSTTGGRVSAEWRQEPRRHVTGATLLRSPCRRGFAPRRTASHHAAPAALRRVDDDRPQAGVACREIVAVAPVVRVSHGAYWRTCYILRDGRPAPRPVDARRSESRVGCWRAVDRAIPPSSSYHLSGFIV